MSRFDREPLFDPESPDPLIKVQAYKITADGIKGYFKRRLDISSTHSEAEEIISAAKSVGSINQDEETPITFKPDKDGYEIKTDRETSELIAKELQSRGYIDEQNYQEIFQTLCLEYGVYKENIPVNTLLKARDIASLSAKYLVDKELKYKKNLPTTQVISNPGFIKRLFRRP